MTLPDYVTSGEDITGNQDTSVGLPDYVINGAEIRGQSTTQIKGGFSPAAQEGIKEMIAQMSPSERFIVGMGKGFSDVYTGTKQRLSELGNALGLTEDETVKRLQEEVQQNRDVFAPLAEESFAAKAGEFVGEAAPLAVVPGGVAGGFIKRAATAGIAGGVSGYVQPTVKGESPSEQAAIGVITGIGVSGGMSLGGKLFNTLFKKLPKNKVRALGEKYAVRTTLGEETGNPLIQQAETWLEKVPLLGLKGFREKQQAEAQRSARKFLSKYIAGSPEDFADVTDAMMHNRAYVDSLYHNFSGMLQDIKEKVVPAKTRVAAKELLKRYPSIFKEFQDTEREKILRSIVSGTKPTRTTTGGGIDLIRGVLPEKITTKPASVTFDDIWELRKGLGTMLGQARKKLARGEVDETQIGIISKLFGKLNDDIDDWANKIGKSEIRDAFKTANEAYKQFVVKYDILDNIFARAEGKIGAGEMFSPKKLSSKLKDLAWKQKKLKIFQPDEVEEMVGLANIMQIVKRAGQYAENPPTGARWGGLVTTSLSGLKSVPFVTLGRFMETGLGKKIAFQASKIEPKSPAMGKLINQLYNQLPKMSALGATKE